MGDTSLLSAAQISSYLAEIENELATACRRGLVVILAMQDQRPRPCGEQYELPKAETVQARKTLSAQFSDDPDAIFELYNEAETGGSNAGGSNAQWKQWAQGGSSPLSNAGRTNTRGQNQHAHPRGWRGDARSRPARPGC